MHRFLCVACYSNITKDTAASEDGFVGVSNSHYGSRQNNYNLPSIYWVVTCLRTSDYFRTIQSRQKQLGSWNQVPGFMNYKEVFPLQCPPGHSKITGTILHGMDGPMCCRTFGVFSSFPSVTALLIPQCSQATKAHSWESLITLVP